MKKMNLILFSKYPMRILGLMLFMTLGLVSYGQTDAESVGLSKQETLNVYNSTFSGDAAVTATLIQNEINSILNNPTQGGNGEVDQSLRLSFYYDIMVNIKRGKTAAEAIINSYPAMKSKALNFTVSVDTEAILQSTLDLLD
ncbi:MAG TPA: hypothetical protein ENK52_02945 [Saprospiraceae bacterium]|nr:hypothetical protein [Saprospiraceae bacterium]